MKRIGLLYMVLLLVFGLSGCKGKREEQTQKAFDTIPMLVNEIQKCSRLYTVEYKIHKIITHDDRKTIKGSLFNKAFSLDIPMSKRMVAIPIDATIKGYIDFESFSSKNVKRTGNKIEITLPDPRITMTATKIDHNHVKQFVNFMRSDFTDAELSDFERQGRAQIIHDISQTDILENARLGAAKVLIPLLRQAGYNEKDITISFRNNLQSGDIPTLIDKTNEHGK